MQSLVQTISQSSIRALRRNGYCIIDDTLPEVLAGNILSEIKPLHEFGIMYPCHSHFKYESETTLIPKQNVWELELHSYPELQPICADLTSLLHDQSLCRYLNESQTNPFRYSHQTLKILYSEKNGCFPFHFDSDPEIDSRRITAILYLNEQPIDGGELMLFPLLQSPRIISPKWNRLVLFSSCFMLHRTLPSMDPRHALNFWIHTENEHEDVALKLNENLNAFQSALSHKYLKCTAKLLYDEEWTQSMLESHGDSKDTEWMIQSHRNDVEICRRAMIASGMNSVYEQIQSAKGVNISDRFLSGESWSSCDIDWFC